MSETLADIAIPPQLPDRAQLLESDGTFVKNFQEPSSNHHSHRLNCSGFATRTSRRTVLHWCRVIFSYDKPKNLVITGKSLPQTSTSFSLVGKSAMSTTGYANAPDNKSKLYLIL